MERLVARTARPADTQAIVDLNDRIFGEDAMTGWAEHHLTAHLEVFPQGQFVVEVDDLVVASASSMLVDRGRVLEPHTWMTLTGGNELPNHDPDGDVLYGLEIGVDPEHQGLGLSQVLYRCRKVLAREMGLWGIAVAGRMPGYAAAKGQADELSPEDYVRSVEAGTRSDPVLSAQMAAGFEPERVLENYVKDPASEHHAALMTWTTEP